MNQAERTYLSKLEKRAIKAGEAHHRAASFFETLDTWAFAIPSLLLAFVATILSTAVLLTTDPPGALKVSAVIVTATATALTAARNQVGAAARAEGHQRSGVAFNSIRRKAAATATNPNASQPELQELNTMYDEAGQSAPIVPRRIWNRADQEVTKKFHSVGESSLPSAVVDESSDIDTPRS